AGEFRMGTGDNEAKWLKEKYGIEAWPDEQPSHTVYVSEFQIGRYPVTNAEYRAFVKAGGYNPDQPWWQGTGRLWRTAELRPDTSFYSSETRQTVERWLEQRPAARRHQPFYWDDAQWSAGNLPVVGVTWYEAQAYCNWLCAASGQTFRLPTEAEWEKAARGPGNAQWPWGNEWDDGCCNSAESDLNATTPVGMYPHGAAVWPGGAAEDMVGNVWQWCGDWWDEKLYEKRAEAEQVERDPHGPLEGLARVGRGGSYFDNRGNCRAACRDWNGPANFSDLLGFRVVRSP
ncbi:MAG: SUMF1/EgtB/PvdO family nonheme iron enzyme, partial [Anaerolineales bacterium]|nr:SUMF1/EgtB/PvdO family nonheme iron enzyme [Anaerolineales bacterium]